ncbi:unnamed protein product [Anisakis simplex]|uniref:Uncharacterized protein n=1 Tax=Anisakis simplex TaxID=6269 RepID=A0A0M3JZA8_ANISI|nr:unnamed protein product [Anisakis simplex]
MKLAKRRREELIDQHWNRKTVRVTITTTVTTPTVQQQGALESADDDDVTDSSEVEELSREETDSSEADDSMEFVSEEVELENAAVEKTSRSIDVGERNDKMDERKLRSENVTETTATSVPADLAVEPAKIMVMGDKTLSG